MSLSLRIAFHLRRFAARFEEHHRRVRPWPHQWEISRRAKQFVADHANIADLDELTDLALKRGIYSSKQSRKTIRWRLHRMRTLRTLPAPSHSPSSILHPRCENRELLKG